MRMKIRRGDIFLAQLDPVIGSEQGRIRPVLIIQNDFGNKVSPTTIITPLTTRIYSKEFATNVEINKKESKLKVDSTVLLNQIRAIDKRRVIRKLSSLDIFTMKKVDLAIKISLDLL